MVDATGVVRQVGPKFDSLRTGVRLAQVVETGRLTDGPFIRELEERLTDQVGRPVIAVSSGAAAFDIALEIVARREGEVIVGVPVIGHWTDMSCVIRAGHSVQWLPVGQTGQGTVPKKSPTDQYWKTLHIDIGGQNTPTDAYFVDASHAMGDPRYLGQGRAAFASLYATKVLTAGEGGLLSVEEDWADEARALRDSGRDPNAPRTGKEKYLYLGTDRRLNELAAALACESLDTLEDRVTRRRHILHRYEAALPVNPYLVDTTKGAFKALVKTKNETQAETLRSRMQRNGVEPASGVFELALPDMAGLHGRVPPCDGRILKTGREWAESHVAVPIHETMDDDDVAKVTSSIFAS